MEADSNNNSSGYKKNNPELRDSEETMIVGALSKKPMKRKFSFSYEESLSFEDINFSEELSQIFSDSFNYEKKERSRSIGKFNNYYLIFFIYFLYLFFHIKIEMEEINQKFKKLLKSYTGQIIKKKDDEIKQKEDLLKEAEDMLKEKDDLLKEAEGMLKEKDDSLKEAEGMLKEKEQEIERLKKYVEEIEKKKQD